MCLEVTDRAGEKFRVKLAGWVLGLVVSPVDREAQRVDELGLEVVLESLSLFGRGFREGEVLVVEESCEDLDAEPGEGFPGKEEF